MLLLFFSMNVHAQVIQVTVGQPNIGQPNFTVDMIGYGEGTDDGCELFLTLSLTYYNSSDDNLLPSEIVSQSPPFENSLFKSMEGTGFCEYWFTTNFISAYSANSCLSNITHVRINVHAAKTLNSLGCLGDPNGWYSLQVTKPNGEVYASPLVETGGGYWEEFYTFDVPISSPSTAPLSLVFHSNPICPDDLVVYAQPQGGCSPYQTVVWTDALGNVLPYLNIDDLSSPLHYGYGDDNIKEGVVMVNPSTLPYTATVTDNAGNTFSTIYNPYTAINYTVPSGTTEIWDETNGGDRHVYGLVTVESGAVLSINDITVYFANAEAGIYVKKGGKLYVRGCILRDNNCDAILCSNRGIWKGIVVQGIGDLVYQPQTLSGYLSITESTIQRAQIGILATKGALIEATYTDFYNNYHAIDFQPYKYANYSFITGCNFYAEGITALADKNQYYNFSHITVNRNFFKLDFRECLFSDNSGLSLENKGTGIQILHGKCQIKNNTFNGLLKGLDIYGGDAVSTLNTNIQGNTFDNTHKGITMLGEGFNKIKDNNFYIGASFTSIGQTAYGIWAEGCAGIKVIQNNFYSRIAIATPSSGNYGIVSKNLTCAGNLIYNNVFDNAPTLPTAKLYQAIRFEGDNTNLQLNCNHYLAPNIYDWYIQEEAILGNQGSCNTDIPTQSTPSRNQWHLSTAGTYHIYNANPNLDFSITPYNEVYSIPTDNFNTIVGPPCAASGIVNCAPLPQFAPDDIKEKMLQTSDEREYNALLTELMYTRIEAEQWTEAKADLEAMNGDCAKKILTATYTQEAEYQAALEKLAELSLDDDDNIAFYNTYLSLIAQLSGSGKQDEGNCRSYWEQTAANEDNTYNGLYAQAALSQLYGRTFDKNVAANKTQSNSLSSEIATLHLYPVPATDYVVLSLADTKLQTTTHNHLSLLLLGHTGHAIKTYPIATTANLSDNMVIDLPNSLTTGLYWVQLYDSDGHIIAIQKFVVVK